MPRWLREWFRGFVRFVVIVGAGLVALAWTVGTPHVLGEYVCSIKPVYGRTGCRNYSWCAYYGIQGRRTVYPPGSESCSAFRLFRWNDPFFDLR